VALVLSWPSVRTVMPLHFKTATAPQGSTELKVLTFNVMNFGWYDGTQKTENPSMRYILDQNADIVMLQEASVTSYYERLNSIKMMLDEMNEKYPYRQHGLSDIIILSRYPFKKVNDPLLSSYDDNSLSMEPFAAAYDVELPERTIRVVAMHLHSFEFDDADRSILEGARTDGISKKQARSFVQKLKTGYANRVPQAKQLREFLDKKGPDVTLVCGDMNDTPASHVYNKVRGSDLKDAWADCGRGITYTYNDHKFWVKIDHILYRGDLKPLSIHRDKKGDSDHYPLVATFALNP